MISMPKTFKKLICGLKRYFPKVWKLFIKYIRHYESNIIGISESFCGHPEVLEILKIYTEIYLISAEIKLSLIWV